MTSENFPAISDYALLSDCHSSALVSNRGSVDWCCFPRFDAHPVFARILDLKKGGHFAICPEGDFTVTRRYRPDTNILETTFTCTNGEMRLTDCLVVHADHGPDGEASPYHELVRIVECTKGSVTVLVDFHPRFDFGMTTPNVDMVGTDGVLVYGGADGLAMRTEIPLTQTDPAGCQATHPMEAGQRAVLALNYRNPTRLQQPLPGIGEALERVDRTERFWKEWVGNCTYTGRYRDVVVRSALVLKALTNAPTGAIIAAPTTSLPEHIGGVRNWDYRYAWLRDSALNLYALFQLGYVREAHDFMAWLQRTSAGRATDLQPLYGVGGERFVHEIELSWLSGYRDSAPVRIGNAAALQLQHDIYGELMDTAWLFHKHGGEITSGFWEFLSSCVDEVAEIWQEPDEGIWEPRDGKRHFVLSKVMCWVAVDRAIRLADALNLEAPLDEWKQLSTAIRSDVETRGVNPGTGGFRRDYDSTEADGANLLITLVNFLPADDPRIRATVDDVADRLTVDGLVHRYLDTDGLPGEEGTFLICSFWMVDNLAKMGRTDKARELFDQLIAFCNDVGLLSEEVAPHTRELLGNFPQAFSHLGLIGAAINLHLAEERNPK